MPDPGTTAAEQAALKQEFDRLRSRVDELESALAGADTAEAQPAQPAGPSLARRGLMGGGVVGMLALAMGAQPAQGAAQDSGGEGDVGSESTPFEGFVDGLALVTQEVSTSTTVDKPIVRYDSALGSLTLDIDPALEGPSGFTQPIFFIDETGNADTNPVTIEDSSGSTVMTIDAADSWTMLPWDGSEWLTKFFLEKVEAGQVTADDLTINNVLSALNLTLSNDPSNQTEFLGFDGTDFGLLLTAADTTVAGDNTGVPVQSYGSSTRNTISLHVLVFGQQQGASVGFADFLSDGFQGNLEEKLTSSAGTVNRSYSRDGTDIELAIDKAGETFDVGAIAIGGDAT